MDVHEKLFITTFLNKAYRARCIAQGEIPRGDLCHVLESKLDDRYVLKLPNNIHTLSRILDAIQRVHPVESGFFIAAYSDYDRRRVAVADLPDLDSAIVSFLPGRLAYYQAEMDTPAFRCLFVRGSRLKERAAIVLQDLHDYYRRGGSRS